MLLFKVNETVSNPETAVRYFKVERRSLVYLKFILEAYEGMSTLSTVEKSGAIVRLSIPSRFEEAIQGVIDALREEFPIEEVNFEPGDGLNA